MKKSNIYLLSILCSVSLFIIMGALVSVARGKKRTDEVIFNSSVSVSPYSHIVLENTNYDINVKTGEEYKLNLSLIRGEEKLDIPYSIKGDTLFLSKISSDQGKKINYLELNIPIDKLEVKAKESKINFNNYYGKSLNLKLDKAELNIFNAGEKGFSTIDIQCINKSTFYSKSKVGDLQIDIRDSDFENWGAVENITGTITEKSFIRINKPGRTKVEKDKDSKVEYFYN